MIRWLQIMGLACLVAQVVSAAEPWSRHVIDDASRGADGVRLADVNRDGRLDIVTGWEEGGVVRVCFQPRRDRLRDPWPGVSVGSAKSVEDAVAVDLDGDGNLDVVSCCEGKTKTIFVHWAPEPSHVQAAESWVTQPIPASIGKQQWMFCLPLQVDGSHGPDLIVGSKGTHAAVGWWQAPKNPRQLSGWKYHRLIDAGWIMSLIAADMNGDGVRDILFSDRRGSTRGVKWLQIPKEPSSAHDWKLHTIGAVDREVMFLGLGDLDDDRVPEVVATTRNRVLDIFHRRANNATHWERFVTPLPFGLVHSKSVAIGDFDLDGRTDLVTTNRSVPLDSAAVALMRYPGAPFAGSWRSTDLGGPAGSKFDLIEPLDLDNDGDLDLITCEEVSNLGVIWYENPAR